MIPLLLLLLLLLLLPLLRPLTPSLLLLLVLLRAVGRRYVYSTGTTTLLYLYSSSIILYEFRNAMCK